MLVLVGMSIREAQARHELLTTAADLGAEVAYLQVADPSLGSLLTRLADAGVASVTLIGISLGRLAPGASWLRRIAGHWLREHGGPAPQIRVAERLVDDLADLVALDGPLDDLVRRARPVSGREPGLTSAAWEEIPRHRHQVFVCRGPRCTAAGSERTAESLVLALMVNGLGDDDVLVTHTGCQFPCNHAPVVTVQPDDVWYGGVDPDTAAAIVGAHLIAGGEPLRSHRLTRT